MRGDGKAFLPEYAREATSWGPVGAQAGGTLIPLPIFAAIPGASTLWTTCPLGRSRKDPRQREALRRFPAERAQVYQSPADQKKCPRRGIAS